MYKTLVGSLKKSVGQCQEVNRTVEINLSRLIKAKHVWIFSFLLQLLTVIIN